MSGQPGLEGLTAQLLVAEPSAAELDAARLRVFDAVCAIAAGSTLSEWAPARRWLQGPVAAPLTGRGAAAPDAGPPAGAGVAAGAGALAACCRLTEVDDVHLASCTTPGSVVVPVVLVLAGLGAPPRTVLDGVVAGYEAVAALGERIGGASALQRGLWPTRAVAAPAAALTAARVLGLTAAVATEACALAVALRLSGRPPEPGRALSLGEAVRFGVAAALAAAAGVRGDRSLLEHWPGSPANGHGAPSPSPPVPTAGGARRPAVLESCVKPFAAARQVLSAVAPLRQLVEDGRLAPETVGALEVAVPSAHAAMVDRPRVETRLDTLASMQLQLALALDAPGELDALEHAPAGAALAARMGSVRVRAEPALDAGFPAAWRCELRVTSATGDASVIASGGPALEHELTWTALEGKWRRLLAANPAFAVEMRSATARCGPVGATGGASDADAVLVALRAAVESGRLGALADAAASFRVGRE